MSETDPVIDPVMERLEEQLGWYDRKSISSQRTYRRIKTIEIVAAAVIPLLGAFRAYDLGLATGALGVLITVLEGLLHLNQYHQNWIGYRATCESLQHEKYLCLAKAGDYATAADPRALLAERVESLVSQEHGNWVSTQKQVTAVKPIPS